MIYTGPEIYRNIHIQPGWERDQNKDGSKIKIRMEQDQNKDGARSE